MAITSIKNKGKYGEVLAGNTPPGRGFVLLNSVTVGSGGQSTISFTSIPQTYTHLQVRAICKGSSAEYLRIRFNGDTGSNYFAHNIQCNGSAVNAYAHTSITGAYLFPSGMSDTANVFSGVLVDILDYKNTNKNKTTRSLHGQDTNGAGFIYFMSGAWNSTAAITSIDFVISSGTFTQYSHFALYGILGVS